MSHSHERRDYQIIAQRAPIAPAHVQGRVSVTYEAIGAAGALQRFRWDMEKKYGPQAKKYYPADLIIIQEV